jgi:YD repeat-containing protein
MKKTMKFLVLAVVFMVVSAASVFAASGDYLVLKTEVAAIKPAYQIWGYDPNTAQKGDKDGTEIDWTLDSTLQAQDPSAEDVVLQIDIRHVGLVLGSDNKTYDETGNVIRYRNTSGITLTITPTALSRVTSETDTLADSTDVPTAGDITVQSGTTGLTVTSAKADKGVVTITPSYTGEKITLDSDASKTIASWEYTWAKDETLALGEYQATITLTYTAA